MDTTTGWLRWDQGLPTTSNVSALAAGPGNPAALYAGLYDPPGVWHSADLGNTWNKEDIGQYDHPVYALLWDPQSRTLWAGTEGGLLFRSAGVPAWHTYPQPLGPVLDLALDDTGRVYAVAQDQGLLRLDESSGVALLRATDQALSVGVSASGNELYLGTGGEGVWASHDGGQNWIQPSTMDDTFVWAITVDAENDDQVYAHTRRKVYRSSDAGRSWELVPALDRRTYGSTVARDGTVLVGLKGRVARSSDGGSSWTFDDDGLHPGIEVFDLIEAQGSSADQAIYAAARDGVYASKDDGVTWTRLQEGPGYKTVEALCLDGRGGMVAATPLGLFRRPGQSPRWEPSAQELGLKHMTGISRNERSQVIYASSESGLLRSADDGRTWEEIRSALQSQSISGVLVDPDNADHLFIHLAFERVYESVDGGRTWTARWDGMGTDQVVQCLAYSSDGDLWSGTDDGLFRWDVEAKTWLEESAPFAGDSVFTIAFDDAEQRLYAGTTSGVWRRQPGGGWEPCGPAEMKHTVTELSVSAEGRLYAGTNYAGLWQSCNSGGTWSRVSGIPAEASVRDMLLGPEEGTLFVATDRGLYRGEEEACLRPHLSLWGPVRDGWDSLLVSLKPALHASERYFAPRPLPAVHTLRPDDQILRRARDLGFRSIVQVLSWEETEPTRGEWHWEFPDYLVQAVEYYGLDLIVRLDHPPQWARTAPPDGDGYPFDIERYLRFVSQVSRRYGDAIRGYVIWNEPNLAEEWGATPDPAKYADLLRRVYPLIGASAPRAAVVSAGLAPTNDQTEDVMDDRIFLDEMYEAGAQPFFDALGAHAYGFAYPPGDPHGAHDGLNVNRLLDLRAVMETNNDQTKPVWITEIGWTTDGQGEHRWLTVSAEEQGDYLRDAWLKARDQFPWVELFTVWNLRTAQSERDGEHAGYSLLRRDGTTKPAANDLQSAFSSGRPMQDVIGLATTWLRGLLPDPSPVCILASDETIHLGDNE